MAGCVRQIDTGDPRLCAVSLMCNIGPILFVCVYMPNDTGDYECVENYIDTCARLSAIFAECEAVHLVVAGDFNTHLAIVPLSLSLGFLMTIIFVGLIITD
jgi:hypothetical protein